MDNGDVADNTLDGRAGQVVRDADDMAENVAIGTGARLVARHAPGPGTVAIGLVVDVIAAEEGGDPADGAGFDQAVCVGDGRILGVVVTDDGLAAAGRGCIGHRLRIGKRCRHRLFTPHMFAGCERRNRDFGMRVVRRADGHKFDRRVVHHRPPVIGIAAESEVGGALRGALRAEVANDFQPWPEPGPED